MPKFSLIVPTRHRPEFVNVVLECFSRLNSDDIEIIISDNPDIDSMSCKDVFYRHHLINARYITPGVSLGMVDHWNFALQHAKGDYLLFFTDKMFIKPDAVDRISRIIDIEEPEIISWTDDLFHPVDQADPLGAGYCYKSASSETKEWSFFDPSSQLSKCGSSLVDRALQSRSDFSRGKICFGAYRKDLIERIIARFGALFYPLSLDHTSMIFALSIAKTAVECSFSGIVHLSYHGSNGDVTASSDQAALEYLKCTPGSDAVLMNGLVPGVYASINNSIASDYLFYRNKFNLNFEFNRGKWLARVWKDIHAQDRVWSSDEVEQTHKKLVIEAAKALVETDVIDFNAVLNEDDRQHAVSVRQKIINFTNLIPGGAEALRRLRPYVGRQKMYPSLLSAVQSKV